MANSESRKVVKTGLQVGGATIGMIGAGMLLFILDNKNKILGTAILASGAVLGYVTVKKHQERHAANQL